VSWIVADMIAAGECNGLTLGFVREIADQLKTTRGNLLFAAIATDLTAIGVEVIRKLWRNGRSKIAVTLANAL
jgi:hypothetical protein